MEYRQFGHWIRIEPDRIRIGRRNVFVPGVAAAVLGLVALVLLVNVLLAATGVSVPTSTPNHRPIVALLMAGTVVAVVLFRFVFRYARLQMARSDDDTLMVWIDRKAGTVMLPDGTSLGPTHSAVQFQRLNLTNNLQGLMYRMYIEIAGRRFHIFTSGIKHDREAIAAALGIPHRK